jgi:hypothetical protein
MPSVEDGLKPTIAGEEHDRQPTRRSSPLMIKVNERLSFAKRKVSHIVTAIVTDYRWTM